MSDARVSFAVLLRVGSLLKPTGHLTSDVGTSTVCLTFLRFLLRVRPNRSDRRTFSSDSITRISDALPQQTTSSMPIRAIRICNVFFRIPITRLIAAHPTWNSPLLMTPSHPNGDFRCLRERAHYASAHDRQRALCARSSAPRALALAHPVSLGNDLTAFFLSSKSLRRASNIDLPSLLPRSPSRRSPISKFHKSDSVHPGGGGLSV